MRFSKFATILQGASLFVATCASFKIAHVSSESKSFNCLGRRFTEADFSDEIDRANRQIAAGNMIRKAANIIEHEIRRDGERNTILYSDGETTDFYLYRLSGHKSVKNENGYAYHIGYSILIDNCYRVSAMMSNEEWVALDENAAANRQGKIGRQSFCTINT
ncbi:BgtE-20014 [Blumeria graminis f. sp. tritici]|uniref:BgtE-20014 n=2 Tax=Blumeria graminis f. sp. tritici TaxID=62690 RepID=A0A381L284_BLUGR|nr:BgtE-20014 [Blumeria graminis f. sp. tritici]